jgi:hypothetical protein
MIGLAAASRRETVNPLWPWIAGTVAILSLAETAIVLGQQSALLPERETV